MLGPKMLSERNKEKLRMDVVDEQIDSLGRAFLGLTLGCARCHDHKFDPLLQKDYFRMKAFFAAFQPTEKHPVATAAERKTPLDLAIPELVVIAKQLRRATLRAMRQGTSVPSALPVAEVEETPAEPALNHKPIHLMPSQVVKKLPPKRVGGNNFG